MVKSIKKKDVWVYDELNYLTPSKFLVVPYWVQTLAINSDGSLWGYESLKDDLECNSFRHWSPKMDTMSVRLGMNYDIIRWEKSAIARSEYQCR